MLAEERRFYVGYLFSESEWSECKDGIRGMSIVELDRQQRCSTFYYVGAESNRSIYNQMIDEIEYVTQADSSQIGCMYYGKSTNGTYFVEKQFYKRPTGEGILFYQIPKEYYEEVIGRLSKQWYLPLELFRDSLFRLMEYKLTGVLLDRYEEGWNGCALINLGYAKSCVVHYFNGAMMGTPLYLSQIKEIERVEHSNMSTGELYYGKSKDGTFFVEKEFSENLHGMPQGLIMFGIPEACYEDVLQRITSLPYLPTELFEVKPSMER